MTYKILFRTRLAKKRKLLGKSQEAMAEALGIHYKTYQTYETGERMPSFANLRRIALGMEMDANTLLCVNEGSDDTKG